MQTPRSHAAGGHDLPPRSRGFSHCPPQVPPPHPAHTRALPAWPLRALGFAEPTLGDVGGGHRAAPGIRAGLAHWERLPWTLKEVAAPRGPVAFSEWPVLVRIHTVDIQRANRLQRSEGGCVVTEAAWPIPAPSCTAGHGTRGRPPLSVVPCQAGYSHRNVISTHVELLP